MDLYIITFTYSTIEGTTSLVVYYLNLFKLLNFFSTLSDYQKVGFIKNVCLWVLYVNSYPSSWNNTTIQEHILHITEKATDGKTDWLTHSLTLHMYISGTSIAYVNAKQPERTKDEGKVFTICLHSFGSEVSRCS